MRKKIAAFIGEIGREFQAEFVRTLSKIANEHDYDVFVFSNFGFYTSTHLFDAAEIDLVKLPVFSEFDGVILIPDTFDLEGMEEMIIKRLEKECTCPVVSVRSGSDKTYRIFVDDYKTTYNLTKHFIDDHKFTKICYMSGPLSAPDAVIRRNGFRDAMADSGLDVNSRIEFEGDYWVFKGKAALGHFLKAYDGVPEAIICANDHMAISVSEELKRLGCRIPEDVCVSGFDEIVEGQGYEPSLTTVHIPTSNLAHATFDIIEQVNSGKDVPRDTYLSGQIKRKGSCGCNIDHSASAELNSVAHKLIDSFEDIRMSGIMTTDVVSYIKEEDKLALLGSYYNHLKSKRGFLCLCTDNRTEDNPYSETMVLRKIFNPLNDNQRDLFHPILRDPGEFNPGGGIEFDRKDIIPELVYNSSKPSCYIVHSIHQRDTIYGYLVNELGDADLTYFIAPFISALAVAYDDLRLQREYNDFAEIKKQNLLDPMTGIFNRRGYEENLSIIVRERDVSTNLVSFISCDMDNLKLINDNYGHMEGDFALITIAEVLKSCIGDNGICARTGGDEFAVILTSDDLSFHENFKDLVETTLANKAASIDKPYPLHVSLGRCTTVVEVFEDMNECTRIADERMYEAKRAYKESLKH